MLKPFRGEKNKWGPEMAMFQKMGVQTLDIGLQTPKRHILARNRVVWRILRQNRCARLGCHFVPRGAKSCMRRTETPKPIWMKLCLVVDIPDLVTYTSFGDHRLRVLGGQIFPSLIDFHRRLTTLSHYRASVLYFSISFNSWLRCYRIVWTCCDWN